MIKKVEFGINESKRTDRLDPGWDKIDINKGIAEYLGIVRVGNKNLMITLNTAITDFEDRYSIGKIMVSEIDYDSYQDGSIVVYYNLDKCPECYLLEEKINNEMIKKMLKSGENIYDILNIRDIKLNPSMEKRIINEFNVVTDYIYPKDFDYSKASQLGGNYEKSKEIRETQSERLIVTGISNTLFNSLKESKNNHMSIYQMSKYIERLQSELKESKEIAGNKYGR